jgi:hypothetical protein
VAVRSRWSVPSVGHRWDTDDDMFAPLDNRAVYESRGGLHGVAWRGMMWHDVACTVATHLDREMLTGMLGSPCIGSSTRNETGTR